MSLLLFSGDVDIIICNAAIVKFGYCQELSTDDLRNSFDVNVHGVLNVNTIP